LRCGRKTLFLDAALACDFPGDQEAPDGFVGVEGVAGFADFFFGHVPLAARPGMAAILDGVEGDLGILLATIEEVNLG
jgi:hypothetical protein